MRKKKAQNTISKIPRKIKAQKKERVSKTPKVRNNGTMTESGFWSFIRSSLRNRSRFWKPILKVKEEGKVPYVGTNKRRRFSYVCGECKQEFDSKSVNVHHIHPVGTLTCAADLPAFVENLFCEKESLILLCNGCHDKIHKK